MGGHVKVFQATNPRTGAVTALNKGGGSDTRLRAGKQTFDAGRGPFQAGEFQNFKVPRNFPDLPPLPFFVGRPRNQGYITTKWEGAPSGSPASTYF